jgi:outer membrane receptor protein involved in Fe transport
MAGWHQTWSGTFATEFRVHQVSSLYHFNIDDATATSYGGARRLMGLTPVNIAGDYTFGDTTTQQVEVQANWDPSTNLHFVMGADTRKVNIKKVIFLGVNNDENVSASGGFLSMDWVFTPDWTVSVGLRAENEGLGGSRTSPRTTLVWAPSPTSILRIGYFTSTRSPQVAETKVDYTFPSANAQLGGVPPLYLVASRILPNDQLKPEKSTNFEIGYRQSFGAATLDLTVYQMKVSDQITSVFTGTTAQVIQVPVSATVVIPEKVPIFTTQFQSKGSATNKGAEVAVTWMVQKDWKVGVNGRYLTYTQDDLGNATGPASWNGEFSYAPKHLLTAWTRYSHGPFSGYFDIQHIGSAHVESLTASGVTLYDERPAYLQTDLQVGYEFIKGATFALYARNAAREFTLQGGAGPDRPFIYQVQRRELGATLSYRF